MAAFSSMGRIPGALCEELEEAEEEPVALKYWLRSCIGKNHSGWRIFFRLGQCYISKSCLAET